MLEYEETRKSPEWGHWDSVSLLAEEVCLTAGIRDHDQKKRGRMPQWRLLNRRFRGPNPERVFHGKAQVNEGASSANKFVYMECEMDCLTDQTSEAP